MKRSLLFSMMIMSVAFAQNSPPAPQDQPAPPPAAPTPLPTPAITGPLHWNVVHCDADLSTGRLLRSRGYCLDSHWQLRAGCRLRPQRPGQQPVPGGGRNWVYLWRQHKEAIRTPAPTRALGICMTTSLLLAPADRFNAYINFDFGRNSSPTGVTSTWKGIAGAAKFRFNDRFALTPRLQWFDDTNGFSTGAAQSVKEFTFTAGAKVAQGVLVWAELQFGLHPWHPVCQTSGRRYLAGNLRRIRYVARLPALPAGISSDDAVPVGRHRLVDPWRPPG